MRAHFTMENILVPDLVLLLIMIPAFYATPGPAIISIVASGVSYGFKKSVSYVWGIICGGIVVVVISIIGVIYLIKIHDLVLIGIKSISLIYMLYLVYKIWYTHSVEISGSKPLSFANGVLLSLLNPKAYIITVALFAQFINPDTTLETIVFISLILISSFSVIDFVYCYLGETLFKILSKRKIFSSVNKIMALLLLATILYLAIQGW